MGSRHFCAIVKERQVKDMLFYHVAVTIMVKLVS